MVEELEKELEDVEDGVVEDVDGEQVDNPVENSEESEGGEIGSDPADSPENTEELGDDSPWMKTGDEEEPVSVRAHVKLKKKYQTKLDEKDKENEELRKRVEALESGSFKKPLTRRPDPVDFDTDEEYERALDDYEELRYKTREAEKQQRRQLDDIKKRRDMSVKDHFERAERFVSENKIDPNVYEASDTKLRETLDNAFSGNGDTLLDTFIDVLGEGSEKVSFFIGRNKKEQEKVVSLLKEDPSGLRLTAYLGGLNEKFKSYKKTNKSNARKPAAQATGGDSVKGEASLKALKAKYDKHHKNDEGDLAWKIKRQAKKAGYDVSGWANS